MTALVDLHDVFVVHPGPAGGVAALRGLTLAVDEGELCVVLGPSGSGKSTLVRVLAGLERPSAGRATVAGLDLGRAGRSRLDRHRGDVLGYADQHYWRALSPGLTVADLVALPLGLRGVARAERTRRAHELLERVGLLSRTGDRAAELSGGEQQRVALCAALAPRPRLLLADEPTGELDRPAAAAVYALLGDLCRQERAAAVLVSHDPESASIADRVVHVRDGRVGEEHRAGAETVVVGRGGWLHVAEETLRAAGIGTHATVTLVPGAVELRAAGAGERTEPRASASAGAVGRPVELRGVSHAYGGAPVLRAVDLRFEAGLLTAVTGPSGSGKSTLLRLVAGLATPERGEVRVGDVVVSELDREGRAALRRELIGFVGQTATLVDALTAHENVRLALALRGIVGDDAEERAATALVDVGLAEVVGRPVGRLSAGERERVALARVVAAQPPVLVLDEPTARLDSAATASVATLLATLAHRHGTTVVCSTHDPLVVAQADSEVPLAAVAALPSAG